jgi:hypothetical protein
MSFTVTPVARGMRNVFKVEVWKGGVAVATLWRRNVTEAEFTGRRYTRLLGGSDG